MAPNINPSKKTFWNFTVFLIRNKNSLIRSDAARYFVIIFPLFH